MSVAATNARRSSLGIQARQRAGATIACGSNCGLHRLIAKLLRQVPGNCDARNLDQRDCQKRGVATILPQSVGQLANTLATTVDVRNGLRYPALLDTRDVSTPHNWGVTRFSPRRSAGSQFVLVRPANSAHQTPVSDSSPCRARRGSSGR